MRAIFPLAGFALAFLLSIPAVTAEPALLGATGSAGGLEEGPASTPTTEPEQVDPEPGTTEPEVPDIVVRPDVGRSPEDAGDRGGVLQATLLVAMVGGVAAITALAVRESRRNRTPK